MSMGSSPSDKILFASIFNFIKTEAEFRNKLSKLVDEYCAEIAEAVNDVAKDISNRIDVPNHEEKQILLLSVVIAAVSNSLAFYMGNYEQPYRSLIVEAVADSLKETVEDAASFIRKNPRDQA